MARKDHPAAKAVSERRKAMDEQNADYYAREAAARPTPTQEENDLAKVGALNLDDKEPDGAEPEADALRRTMEGRLPGGSPYDTRSLGAADDGAKGGKPKR